MNGETLGPYRIVEKIGLGGMATVYKAFQPALQRYVAVKVLPPHLADSPGFAQRFQQEALTVARLEHPHILPVYDFGQEAGKAYIVARYIEGGTLRGMMGTPMPLPRIAELIGQIAQALDYAHERGVIHRDVKPSNVLLDSEGRAYLTDFGVARILEATQHLTGTGVGVGTPAYMSPEQGQGRTVDRRSDVYSLGVVLYEMLTGKVPYEAETPIAVVLKHIHDPLPLPSKINPAVPQPVERVVQKALAKSAAARYQTAGQMAGELRAAIHGAQSKLSAREFATESVPFRAKGTAPMRIGLVGRALAALLLIVVSVIVITQVAWPQPAGETEGEGPSSPSAMPPSGSATHSPPSEAAPTESFPPSPAPTSLSIASPYSCNDPLGCLNIPPGSPVMLGYLLSMQDANGIEGLAAIQLAVEEHGDVRGHVIQLVGEDDGCEEDVARDAALGFLDAPSIAAVIGTTCSPGARVAAPLLSDAGLILISPSNKGNDLTEPSARSPGYFRVSSSDVLQGKTAAEFAAAHLNAGRAAILYASGDLYSEPLANAFRQSFEELGGKVVFAESVDGDGGDLIGRVSEVATSEPDLIYLSLYAALASQLTVELKAGLPSGVHLMGPDSLWSESFIDSIGSAGAEGVYVSAPTREFDTPAYTTFVAGYEAHQGVKPTSVWHAYAYDTALLILAAIDQAAVVEGDGTLHIGRQDLRDALYSIGALDGLTGTLVCRPNGDCGQPRYSVYQYRSGELVRVH